MALRGEDPKSYGTLSEDKVEEEEVRPSLTVSVRRQHRAVVIFSAVVVGLVLLSLIIAVVYKQTRPEPSQPSLAGSGLYGEYEVAAVASDGAPCAKMAGDILRENGTAVDAAVAALVCNGVYNSHSMGLGGGFLLTFYNRSSGQAGCLNARETAPGLSSVNMFSGDSKLSAKGPLSVAVPGEIAGYWEARRLHGNPDISWRRILQPTIDMCREGIPVSATMANTLAGRTFQDPEMASVFLNPQTGQGWLEGQNYTRPGLAATLERLARAGPDGDKLFYNGPLGQALVTDLADRGGILTMQDLNYYRAEWMEPLVVKMTRTNLSLVTFPPPGSGAVLAAILNIIQNYEVTEPDPLFYHRLVESYKWAYAARTRLGDPADLEYGEQVGRTVEEMISQDWAREKFLRISDSSTQSDPAYYGAEFYNQPDSGTAHLSVLDKYGNAVAVTSTVNLIFGSEIMSPSTGIILNDQMDDFSFPNITNDFGVAPSPTNFIKPGKRPLSSMSPSVLLRPDGEVELVVGASGGTKITTATALVTALTTLFNLSLEESVDTARLHHQLSPMVVEHETGLSGCVVAGLQERGHSTKDTGGAGSVVGAVLNRDGVLAAKADFRKSGGVDGF